MSQLTNTSVVKFNSLQELKRAHAETLLLHAYQAQFKREPTSDELTYWSNFLLNGGDLRELLKRLPEGPDVIAQESDLISDYVASNNNTLGALTSDTRIEATTQLGEAIQTKTGSHQGVITLVGKAGLFYTGRPAKIYVLVENLSAIPWASGEVQPVFACYHWRDKTGKVIVYDGIRSRLPEIIEPAARRQVPVSVIPPPVAGEYLLEVTLVHEGVTWMEDDGLTSLRLDLTVDPSVSESGLKILKELQWAKESAAEKFK